VMDSNWGCGGTPMSWSARTARRRPSSSGDSMAFGTSCTSKCLPLGGGCAGAATAALVGAMSVPATSFPCGGGRASCGASPCIWPVSAFKEGSEKYQSRRQALSQARSASTHNGFGQASAHFGYFTALLVLRFRVLHAMMPGVRHKGRPTQEPNLLVEGATTY
jgi:hypothetical protein